MKATICLNHRVAGKLGVALNVCVVAAALDMAKALLKHLMSHHKCKFWCAKSLNTVMSSYSSKGECVEKIAYLVLQELTKVRANPLRERPGGVCHFNARIH